MDSEAEAVVIEERLTRTQLVRWWGVFLVGGSIGIGAVVAPFASFISPLFFIAFGLGVLLFTGAWLADHA